MSADIEKLAVFDDRIVQSRPKYAVEKGALSLTNSPFNAIAANGSQMTFNINVPSENVFVDRAVEWSSACYLSLTATPTTITAGQPVALFGRDLALAAFPLHSLTQTMTATINDTTTTINLGDVLYEVLRLSDYKKNRSQRTCPTYLDTYASYNTAYQTNNNPLGGYELATDSGVVPNGAWGQVQWTLPSGVPLSGSGTYTSGGITVSYVGGVPVMTTGVPAYPLFVKFFSTEKLVLSPFVFSDTHEQETGLFGIQNIQLVMNMTAPSQSATAGRVLRSTTAGGVAISAVAYNQTTAAGTPFTNAQVNVQFLTPSLDIPLPPKSVVPYMEFPRYISNQNFSTVGAGLTVSQVRSQTITLPQIPDLLIIYAKPTAYGATDADYYLPIQRISVNFDNFSGLLSSQTQQQLYGMSFRNGLDMDWEQWSGLATTATSPVGSVRTTGGFLVLKPSQDITLQSGQAPSLVGNFTFQFNCDVLNTSGADLSALTLYVITANSGFFESIKGSSRVIKGVLTEADIISAPLAPMGTRGGLTRAVGGKSVLHRLGNMMSRVKDLVPHLKHMAGMGSTGGASTGGGATGGKKHHSKKSLVHRLME